MPTYQYACTECGHAFEQFQSFSDDALTTCPECEGRLRKLFNAVGVVFKGSGFYRTDSRSESGAARQHLVLRHVDGSSGSSASPAKESTSSTSSTSGSIGSPRAAPPPPPPEPRRWRPVEERCSLGAARPSVAGCSPPTPATPTRR